MQSKLVNINLVKGASLNIHNFYGINSVRTILKNIVIL